MKVIAVLFLPCLLLAGAAVALPRGTNLLPNPGFEETGHWTAYEAGFTLDTTVKHGGGASLRLKGENEQSSCGAMQRIVLAEPSAEPLHLSGYSRAQNADVRGDYNLYADVAYADGTALWGQKVNFTPGNHDWEYGEVTIHPTKPVKSVLLHALFRQASGTVWFDDLRLELLPFKLLDVQPFGDTDNGRSRVSLRATANMPATWTLRVRQGEREFPVVTGSGETFIAVCGGLRPGDALLTLEATDVHRSDKLRWRSGVAMG
ncbi:MAG: hypothetical protein WCP21_19305, partial [Armatimonadota bacterium]